MTSSKNHSASSSLLPQTTGDWLRLVLVALVTPALILAINMGITKAGFLIFGYYHTLICFTVFVLEVALVAWCTGRYLSNPVLRWAVFLWCIALIDANFMYVRFTYFDGFESVGYAFASAQLGLLLAWAVLGTSGIGIRVLAGILGFAGVMVYVAGLTYGLYRGMPYWWGNDWDTILTWQAIATLTLCGALRWSRFRILPVGEQASGEDAVKEPVQFSIRHLLMWTAALAPIFALARLVDWSSFEISYGARLAQYLSLAVLFSIISLVAIWAGIGYGHVLLRMVVALLLTVGAGASMGYAGKRGWLMRLDLDLWQTGNEAYEFWITWALLAGFFYVAMLLVLRASEHRLMRRNR